MKVCEKCGAHNDDSRQFCVDCSQRLGDKLTPEEEQKMHDRFQKTMEKMDRQTDPLHVSRWDKVVGIFSIVGAVACLILLVVETFIRQDFLYLWLGLLCFALAAIEALVPQVTWALEQIRLGFMIDNADDAEPGDFYRVSRRVTTVILAVLGLLVLLGAILALRQN